MGGGPFMTWAAFPDTALRSRQTQSFLALSRALDYVEAQRSLPNDWLWLEFGEGGLAAVRQNPRPVQRHAKPAYAARTAE